MTDIYISRVENTVYNYKFVFNIKTKNNMLIWSLLSKCTFDWLTMFMHFTHTIIAQFHTCIYMNIVFSTSTPRLRHYITSYVMDISCSFWFVMKKFLGEREEDFTNLGVGCNLTRFEIYIYAYSNFDSIRLCVCVFFFFNST